MRNEWKECIIKGILYFFPNIHSVDSTFLFPICGKKERERERMKKKRSANLTKEVIQLMIYVLKSCWFPPFILHFYSLKNSNSLTNFSPWHFIIFFSSSLIHFVHRIVINSHDWLPSQIFLPFALEWLDHDTWIHTTWPLYTMAITNDLDWYRNEKNRIKMIWKVNVTWELSETICDFWIAFDVTLSTASILNLVAISIDR